MPRVSLSAAAAEVAGRDPAFAALMERAGPIRLRAPRGDGYFGDLVSSVMYQQLAGAAAAAIHGRFLALFEEEGLSPEAVLAMPEERIRAAGVSRPKLASIRDLAARVADGTVPLEGISRLPDDEVVARLSVVRGIGRWTAEMFLIFTLRRLDVWPVDDLGVRSGFALIHGLARTPSARELEPEGDRFRPYRTVVAWYCWRAVHLSREEGRSPRRA
ncbi:MAG: DNA-3-methyladenine glycosylase 2 family protein [Actinobacteria bacterium]|nr:DNA-3-methyladenine glycosylase 2 family protein [Actinomycetota bacterium]